MNIVEFGDTVDTISNVFRSTLHTYETPCERVSSLSLTVFLAAATLSCQPQPGQKQAFQHR